MNEKALDAAVKAVGSHYYDLGFKLKPEPARLAAQAAITAYLAAMEAEGFVMAPVEPTARMVVAGANERENGDMELHARKWRAMIAARPNAKS